MTLLDGKQYFKPPLARLACQVKNIRGWKNGMSADNRKGDVNVTNSLGKGRQQILGKGTL